MSQPEGKNEAIARNLWKRIAEIAIPAYERQASPEETRDRCLAIISEALSEKDSQIEAANKRLDIVEALKSGIQKGTLTLDKEAFKVLWGEEIGNLQSELQAAKEEIEAFRNKNNELYVAIDLKNNALEIIMQHEASPTFVGKTALTAYEIKPRGCNEKNS